MTKRNEIWVLARVKGNTVQFLLVTDDASGTTPVSGNAEVSIRTSEEVRVRLRVRSSSGNCVPKWTAISPAKLVSIGDAVSELLAIPTTGFLCFHVKLEVGGNESEVALQLGHTPGGIDIVLKPPPVEPPVPACETAALVMVPSMHRMPMPVARDLRGTNVPRDDQEATDR